jgi:uncharacterized protein (TIGR02099 family)
LHFSGINARLQLSDDSLAVVLESQLSDQVGGLDYGAVEVVARARFAADGKLKTASWHLSVADLLLVHLHDQLPAHPLLPRQGKLSSEHWGQWTRQDGLSGNGKVDIRNTWLSNGATDLMIDHFSSVFAWQGTGLQAWRLDLHDIQMNQGEAQLQLPGLVVARDLSQDLGLWVGADYLPLQESVPIARDFLALLGKEWPEAAPAAFSGSVSGFDLVLAADGSNRSLTGDFRNFAAGNWQRRPGFSGVNGQVRLQSGQGRLSLSAPSLQIDWPEMFQGPLQLSLPECHAELELGADWQIALQGCQLFNEDLSAQGDIHIAASPGKPAADINIEVIRLDIARLSPYWPDGIMPAAVSKWLRSHLHAGQVSSGRLQIHGDLDNWPFRDGQGRFEAWAAIDNGILSFAPGWPELQSVTATARFVGAGMHVEGQAGSFGGVPVERASAKIDNFGRAILEVDFAGQGAVSEVLQLLQQTPLLPLEDFDLSQFQFGGMAQAQGELELPLGRQPGTLQINGSAKIRKGSFLDKPSAVMVDEIAGTLSFDERQLRTEKLSASYKGKPAKLDLQVGGDADWGLLASLQGHFDVQDVLPEFLLKQQISGLLEGSSEWLAQIQVPAKTTAQQPALAQPVMLRLDSGLKGIALELPAPLAKADVEMWPFSLQYPLTGESRLLQLELNQDLHMAAEINAGSPGDGSAPAVRRAVIALGPATSHLTAAALQASDGLSLTGTVGKLDLDGWVDLIVEAARNGGGLGELRLDNCAIQAEELIFLDRWFERTGLEVEIAGNEIRADFEAVDINGQLTFTIGLNAQNSLNAEFDRLALGKPISSGPDTESNPANLPELHLYAQSFRYAGLEMGETRIEAYPTSEGFHFEKVEANSDALSIRASGDWSLQEQGQRSAFDIMLTAESLGDLLQSLDISSSLRGGQTVLQFHAWWPGSPAAFALARLNGEIDFSVTRGQITNASTGSGKVLGLLSIQSLPRRLALDFRDVFDSGFGFETATGTFQLENGTASTNDVKLTSSAARIDLSGSTDLVNQHYDQQMTVMPGVGNTLPVIGAIAGGPGGAAAGLALQGLLHEQLGKATQVHYTIKGSWDEPVIEPVLNAPQKPEP